MTDDYPGRTIKDADRSAYGLGWEYRRREMSPIYPRNDEREDDFQDGYESFICSDHKTNLAMLRGIVAVFLLLLTTVKVYGDYTVARETAIQSERSIALLVLEAGCGLLNDQNKAALVDLEKLGGEITVHSTLSIDGVGRTGEGAGSRLGQLAKAAWRLIGFVFWDAPGSISRVTDCQFRGRRVRIVDTVSNGRVWVRVTIGPPLGDPRVKRAVLELTGIEAKHGPRRLFLHSRNDVGHTRVQLSCSVVVRVPECCIVHKICEREAGPELVGRVNDLADAGRSAVLAGRGQLTEIVDRFIEKVCKQ